MTRRFRIISVRLMDTKEKRPWGYKHKIEQRRTLSEERPLRMKPNEKRLPNCVCMSGNNDVATLHETISFNVRS